MRLKAAAAGLGLIGSLMTGSSAALACSTTGSGATIGGTSLSCSSRSDFSSWKFDWFAAAEESILSTLQVWITDPSSMFNATLNSVSTITEGWGGSTPGLKQDINISGTALDYENTAKSGSTYKQTDINGTGSAKTYVTIRITDIATSVVDGLLTYTVSYDLARSATSNAVGASGGGAASGSASAYPGLFGKGGIFSSSKTQDGTSISQSYAYTDNAFKTFTFTGERSNVPGPIAGAGLPMLLVVAGAAVWHRRRSA